MSNFLKGKELIFNLCAVLEDTFEKQYLQKYCPDKLFGEDGKRTSSLWPVSSNLLDIFELRKKHIYFLESLLSQALWVAVK